MKDNTPGRVGQYTVNDDGLPFVCIWRSHVAMSSLTRTQARVADILSLFMGPDGTNAFPSVFKIADLAKMNESTVRRALKVLREEGWIVGDHRFKDNRQISTVYDAALPSHIPNDMINPLHDETYWAKRWEQTGQSEVHRERRASQRARASGAPALVAGHIDDVLTEDAALCPGTDALCPASGVPRALAAVAPRCSTDVPVKKYPFDQTFEKEDDLLGPSRPAGAPGAAAPVAMKRYEEPEKSESRKKLELQYKEEQERICAIHDQLNKARIRWQNSLFDAGTPPEPHEYHDKIKEFERDYADLIEEADPSTWTGDNKWALADAIFPLPPEQ